MATMTLEVRGMHCPGCAARLGKVLGLQPGVIRASADFLKGVATLETEDGAVVGLRTRSIGVDRAALAAVVSEAGFVPVRWQDEGTTA
jgi:copper chaperone CopZ